MANATSTLLTLPSRASLRRGFAALVALGVVAMSITACDRGRGADDPSDVQQQQPGAGQLPQNGYAQPGNGGQPGIPQGYGPAGQPPGVTAAAPSPLALPCQSDLVCGTHKCNMQSGRCSFPCGSNADCASGFGCMGAGGPAAICIPGVGLGTAPAAPPAQPAQPGQPPTRNRHLTPAPSKTQIRNTV